MTQTTQHAAAVTSRELRRLADQADTAGQKHLCLELHYLAHEQETLERGDTQ